MGWSLKKEKMVEFLEAAKRQEEVFLCMLWGTVYAETRFENRSLASKVTAARGTPGVGGSPNGAFCYIGLTDQSLYVIALDFYNTSNIIGTFAFPLIHITSIAIRRGLFGWSYTVGVECGQRISLTIKGTSLGTNIKDQKERMRYFLASMESLKSRFL